MYHIDVFTTRTDKNTQQTVDDPEKNTAVADFVPLYIPAWSPPCEEGG